MHTSGRVGLEFSHVKPGRSDSGLDSPHKLVLSESQKGSKEPAFLVGQLMDALPKFSGFGIGREYYAQDHASPDDIPILDGFFKKMLDELYDGVYFVNVERRILYWNAAAERLSGYAASEVVGSLCFDNILDHTDSAGCHLCHECCPLAATIETRKQLCKRVFLRHKEGNRIAVEVRVSPVMDERGRTIGAVEIFRDAGSDLALESAYRSARELAQKDPLTGLANRRSLASFVSEQLMLFCRSGRRFSVIMVDLDHFKAVNDTFGHTAGDRVLAEVAQVLLESSREMDLAGRYGGEEFVVVLPNTSLEQAASIAERIRAEIQGRNWGAEIGIPALTASLGVADSCPGDDWDSLISRADAALYDAKQHGRNRAHVARHRRQTEPGRDPVQDSTHHC
jgi:diguanylate cyclase (GGDEF)-like protein/PAS domain S-box-containing protein